MHVIFLFTLLTAAFATDPTDLDQACRWALTGRDFTALAARLDEATARDGRRRFDFPGTEWTHAPRGGDVTDHRPAPATLAFKRFFEDRGYAVSLRFRADGAAAADDPAYDFLAGRWPTRPFSRTAARGTVYVRVTLP